jgi:RNA-binding protein NOB1
MFHHNAFGHLKTASSESESSTPSTPLNRKLATVDNDSIVNSQVTTSTAKATEPSVPSTVESLITVRSSATKDWSTVSDSESDSGRKTPTQSSIQTSLDSLTLSDSDDGEGTWITPTNIKKHKIRDMTTTNTFLSSTETKAARRLSLSSATSGAVMKSACMTGDYAMQNVALQMGLNLVNMEGGGVRHLKTWVLRCHGCFTYFSL